MRNSIFVITALLQLMLVTYRCSSKEVCENRKYLLISFDNALIEIDLTTHEEKTLVQAGNYSKLFEFDVDNRGASPIIYVQDAIYRDWFRIRFDEHSGAEVEQYHLDMGEKVQCSFFTIDQVTGNKYCSYGDDTIYEIWSDGTVKGFPFDEVWALRSSEGYLYVLKASFESSIHRVALPIANLSETFYQNSTGFAIPAFFVDEKYLIWLDLIQKERFLQVFQKDLTTGEVIALNVIQRKDIIKFTVDVGTQSLYYIQNNGSIFECDNFRAASNCSHVHALKTPLHFACMIKTISRRHCETVTDNYWLIPGHL